jgi:purine catabolism regulator
LSYKGSLPYRRFVLVSDLAETPELGITVRVSGAKDALHRRITWCAPTESIDPGPFLTPNVVMITCGMALNVNDPRIWDAYVERLARVPVAALAFGIGPAHHDMPAGLVMACENHGVPLLEIPPDVPFVSVLRDAQDKLAAERYEIIRRGAELADGCTRIAASGGTLQDVLHQIATDIEARVSLADSTGATLVTAGPSSDGGACLARTEFTLPGNDKDRFRLVVEEQAAVASPHVRMLLSPVAAVVSMQLSTTLGSAATASSHNAGRLTESIYTTAAIPTDELVRLARDCELEPYQRTGVVVMAGAASATTTYLRSVAWRARVMLGGEYPHMRYVDGPELSTILVQGGEITAAGLAASACAAAGSATAVSIVVAVAENAAELGLTLRLARRTLGTPGVRQAPVLNFDAVVDTLTHPGVESLARRLLAPITEDSLLLRTLESYVTHSGGTPAICEELYIHRNTLAYRIRKLEELLGVDLSNGQVRATLLLAVRVHRNGVT